MSINNKIQSGFSALIIVVVIVVIALVGALGYVAYDKFIATDEVTEQSAVADDMKTITTTEPAKVVDSADLDEAISTLDQVTDNETSADVNLIDEQVSEF